MASAWESTRNDYRRSPRYNLNLRASVLIYEGIEEGHLPAVLVYTRDISRDGLSLIMPTAALGLVDFQRGGARPLRITLALTTGVKFELVGMSVYCIPYKGGDLGREYIVGVKLMVPERLGTYHDFVASLNRR